jgi:hypothetical protein
MYGLSPLLSTPFVASSEGRVWALVSAAGVAVPVDELAAASVLPRFFFADFDSTFGEETVAGAIVGKTQTNTRLSQEAWTVMGKVRNF